MKKLLLAITFMLFINLPSFAVITPEEAISQDYIRHHGYSNEMTRLIDVQNSQINGTPSKYKSNEPSWYANDKKINFVKKVFTYFDGGLDEGKFGTGFDIKYSNRYDDL